MGNSRLGAILITCAIVHLTSTVYGQEFWWYQGTPQDNAYRLMSEWTVPSNWTICTDRNITVSNPWDLDERTFDCVTVSPANQEFSIYWSSRTWAISSFTGPTNGTTEMSFRAIQCGTNLNYSNIILDLDELPELDDGDRVDVLVPPSHMELPRPYTQTTVVAGSIVADNPLSPGWQPSITILASSNQTWAGMADCPAGGGNPKCGIYSHRVTSVAFLPRMDESCTWRATEVFISIDTGHKTGLNSSNCISFDTRLLTDPCDPFICDLRGEWPDLFGRDSRYCVAEYSEPHEAMHEPLHKNAMTFMGNGSIPGEDYQSIFRSIGTSTVVCDEQNGSPDAAAAYTALQSIVLAKAVLMDATAEVVQANNLLCTSHGLGHVVPSAVAVPMYRQEGEDIWASRCGSAPSCFVWPPKGPCEVAGAA